MLDKWKRHDIVWPINVRKGVQKPFEQCKVLNANNQLWRMPNNMYCALKRIEICRTPRTRTISDKCHKHVFFIFVLQWWLWWWSQSIVINICPKLYRHSQFHCGVLLESIPFFDKQFSTLRFRLFLLFERWSNAQVMRLHVMNVHHQCTKYCFVSTWKFTAPVWTKLDNHLRK